MAQRLSAAARDAALTRISLITAGVVALGLAGTVGLGVAVASETPDKSSNPAPEAEVTAPQEQSSGYGDLGAKNVTPDVATVPATPKGQAAPKVPAAPKAPAPKPKATPKPPVTSSGGS